MGDILKILVKNVTRLHILFSFLNYFLVLVSNVPHARVCRDIVVQLTPRKIIINCVVQTLFQRGFTGVSSYTIHLVFLAHAERGGIFESINTLDYIFLSSC